MTTERAQYLRWSDVPLGEVRHPPDSSEMWDPREAREMGVALDIWNSWPLEGETERKDQCIEGGEHFWSIHAPDGTRQCAKCRAIDAPTPSTTADESAAREPAGEPQQLDPLGCALWDEIERHVQAGGDLPMHEVELLIERIQVAARDYKKSNESGDDTAMADIGFAHGHIFALAAAMLASLQEQLLTEVAIVDRVWDQFGRPTIAQLGGRSIHDLIDDGIAANRERDLLQTRLNRERGVAREAEDAHQRMTARALDAEQRIAAIREAVEIAHAGNAIAQIKSILVDGGAHG